MNLCAIDWGLTADWLSAVASIGTLALAGIALVAWRTQLRGGTKHQIALDTLTAARGLRYGFYDVRSPLYDAVEFPASYHEGGPGAERSNQQEADAFAHIYFHRRKLLWPHIAKLADLRASAGGVLGDDVADAAEALARKARELHFFMDHHIEQLRVGPEIVERWNDQDYVKRTIASVTAGPDRDDRLSKEFEVALATLERLVRPYL